MSAQDWPAGTVATATVRGVEGVRVMRISSVLSCAEWASAAGPGPRLSEAREVTEVRPLVVLDLGDGNPFIRALRSVFETCSLDGTEAGRILSKLADQIEAQTKPPRIPEPGLWGVVEARRRELDSRTDLAVGSWVRVAEHSYPWMHTSGDWTAEWSDLVDPVELRPGITTDRTGSRESCSSES